MTQKCLKITQETDIWPEVPPGGPKAPPREPKVALRAPFQSLLEVPGGPKFPPRALKVALRAPFQVFWMYLGPPVRHWDNFWSTFAPYGISFEHFG